MVGVRAAASPRFLYFIASFLHDDYGAIQVFDMGGDRAYRRAICTHGDAELKPAE